ncbi:class I SAM-dependent methyltransferase [Modestobacter sp. VKM Ac-2983]|uniref:class I SAM-dependent methyltransferase n=1 Tax=Modestobacter sp. VKM Ac-2983 TaxID=3004137 RepID=UPI0022AB84D1|nr:class I SAM-dependent methyltransferase [Modestobacter sp. VKM Ac-2983]MCZ2806471.1 class I SAM-dependent methyltransferase [Modestobacter sp. VKM Ac-2983]
MLRTVRERLREKLGRALQEYVVAELREQAEANRAAVQAAADGLRVELDRVARELREEQVAAADRLDASMRAWERRQRRDLLTANDAHAVDASARFVHAEMVQATPYFAKDDTLAAALKAAPASGLHLEFGVASGGTLRQIAEAAPPGTVFGFDSFEGLPEHWRAGFDAGAFAMDAPPEVPGAELVIGWFDQTLPGFLAEHPEPVAFLHLDADLYSSTVTVLEALEGRLRVGTVLLFDEYFNFPGWEQHEHRAWTEFVSRTGVEFEYLGFTADDEQMSLRITGVPGRAAAAG